MKILNSIAAIALILIIFSCQKEELFIVQEKSTDSTTALTGRPSFFARSGFRLEAKTTEMGGFSNNAMVVFKKGVWAVGGSNTNTPPYTPGSDVWSSSDGKNWKLVQSNLFSSRSEHSLLVYKNKMWVIGGFDASGNVLNDIWNSSNGVDWQRVARFTNIGDIGNNSSVIFRDRIYVFIGDGQTSTKVWSTSDGVAWRLESSGAFPVRNYTQTIVFKNQLYVVGGWDRDNGTYSNDVWASHDGRSWRRNIPGPSSIFGAERIFSPRIEHTITEYNGKVWVIGGKDIENNYSSEMWHTTNMKYWTKCEVSNKIGPLKSHSNLLFKDKLWLFGGYKQASDRSAVLREKIWSFQE